MTSIKETVERLRNDMEHFTAEGSPLRFEAAALTERLAGALMEISNSTYEGDPVKDIARRALSGEPT